MAAPVIVVTGAIASGKSTVAGFLASRGGALINADQVAHSILDKKSVKRSIADKFGAVAIEPNGSVSREKLSEIVFSSRDKMEALNEIMRPYVAREIDRIIMDASVSAPYIVLDAVLFFKYKFQFEADTVIATVAPEEVRIRRLMRRNGFSQREARKRVAFQRYIYGDWKRADIRIDTDRPLKKVKEISEKILEDFLRGI